MDPSLEDPRLGLCRLTCERMVENLLTGVNPVIVLERLVGAASHLVTADMAAVMLPGAIDGNRLVARTVHGKDARGLRGLGVPIEASAMGKVLKLGRPAHYEQLEGVSDGPVQIVPAGVSGAFHGVMIAARDRGREGFDAADRMLLVHLATCVGLAVEFAHRPRNGPLATIPDGVAGTVVRLIFAASLRLAGASSRCDDPVMSARIQEAMNVLDEAVGTIQMAAFSMTAGRDRP